MFDKIKEDVSLHDVLSGGGGATKRGSNWTAKQTLHCETKGTSSVLRNPFLELHWHLFIVHTYIYIFHIT